MSTLETTTAVDVVTNVYFRMLAGHGIESRFFAFFFLVYFKTYKWVLQKSISWPLECDLLSVKPAGQKGILLNFNTVEVFINLFLLESIL